MGNSIHRLVEKNRIKQEERVEKQRKLYEKEVFFRRLNNHSKNKVKNMYK